MDSDENNEDILFKWEELLLKDFRTHALDWLYENKRKTFWRKELK